MLSNRCGRMLRDWRAYAVLAIFGLTIVGLTAPTTAADPKPATADSRLRMPKEATVAAAVKPAEAKAGETVTYSVTVKLKPGWHIFRQAREKQSEGVAGVNTQFDFFDTGGLKPAGDWTPSRPPTRKRLVAAGGLAEFYENEVTWSIPLLVPPGTEPGRKTLRNQIGFQICDDRLCRVPGQWTLPDVVLNVLPAGAAASSAPAAPPAAAVATVEPPGPAAASEPSAPAASPAVAVATVEPPGPAAASEPPAPAVTGEPQAAPSQAVASEVAQYAERGTLAFLLFSAMGGLLALAMPCVWPMVPITVNFFVKQGHQNKGKTTGLAIAYCLAIIGVFTTVGVLVSFFFSATALQNLASNAWLNAAVAALFLAFGLSLLGLFELRLPNFLLNASARGESKGGLIGVMFMALTLTITSFTCTFPVVGGLLVLASRGQFFYPIIGLATFSAVLALPFFLLALAPGLLARMPRSGDWMNSVKVVGGLVEIGAALKFINTAEIGFGAVPSEAWFDTQAVLAMWVVLSTVCGLYLLGLFRTHHDHDEVKVGPGRLLIGSLFLGFALFLAPALFGRPPQSRLWYALVGIFPADVGELSAPAAAGAPALAVEHEARSDDPAQAEREQTSFHGVKWGFSYEQALERAKAENRPVLIDFTGVNCANCRLMEQTVMPRPEVAALLSKFVTVQLYTDRVPIKSITADDRQKLAWKNQERLQAFIEDVANPFYAAIAPDGSVLASVAGAMSPKAFVEFLNGALAKHAGEAKVAQLAR